MTEALFTGWLFELRAAGVPVGTGEWLVFLRALEAGRVGSPDELYQVGRAILCRSEADYDGWDVAFAKVFRDVFAVDPDLLARLAKWLEAQRPRPEGPAQPHDLPSREALWKELFERLAKQDGEHHGGNYWVGTGGRSPFGHSGKGAAGIRLGGAGGGRQAVEVAAERQWTNHRMDRTLETRDLQLALRSVRRLTREGRYELDLDGTIRATCEAAGDITLVERRERENQVHLVLLLDTGGSMDPHAERVSQLFTAAAELRTFKTFETWQFHNAPYGWLYKDYQRLDRTPTSRVLEALTARHRVIFVGDASMAPYELFSASGWPSGAEQLAGIDWIRRFRQRCPASVWLNPEPQRYWEHPTVGAIGQILPMFELTLDGLSRAVKKLRAPV
ncbi:MAG: VWA domain-containing protein [Deltaproteobacteria bacterium]|nr:VWA domain-containing protein [Deltaproteobacteria bacterium]